MERNEAKDWDTVAARQRIQEAEDRLAYAKMRARQVVTNYIELAKRLSRQFRVDDWRDREPNGS